MQLAGLGGVAAAEGDQPEVAQRPGYPRGVAEVALDRQALLEERLGCRVVAALPTQLAEVGDHGGDTVAVADRAEQVGALRQLRLGPVVVAACDRERA